MKTTLAVALVIVISVGVVAGFFVYDSFKRLLQRDTALSSACSDPDSISSHIYHPDRLQIVNPCLTATGTVDMVRKETDGDLHIRLNLDSAYSNLTNSVNDEFQMGDLVVEIICVNPATQTDAIPSCQNYTNHISIPDAGQNITVSGPYVLDRQHAYWAEIHPVYSLVVAESPKPMVSITAENLHIFYPYGATNGWLGPSIRQYAAWHVIRANTGGQFTDNLTLYSTSPSAERISSIAVSTLGFSVVSMSPAPPILFDAGETIRITLIVQTPDSNYYGPIDVEIVAF